MKPNLKQENKLWQQGYRFIAGVDEVGRGAWAGPLVAVAVVFEKSEVSKKKWFSLVRDSKELAPYSREKFFKLINKEVNWSVGIVSNKYIDRCGLAKANKQAFIKALQGLKIKPDFILADYLPNLPKYINGTPSKTFIAGDAQIFSIATASILAKVYRDHMMKRYANKFPGYGFGQHKGYGTFQHQKALSSLGPCDIHRLTYRPLRDVLL